MTYIPFTVQPESKINTVKMFRINDDYDIYVLEIDKNKIECIYLSPYHYFFIFVIPNNEMYVSKYGSSDDFKYKFINININNEDINFFLINTLTSGTHVVINGPPEFIKYESMV